MPDIPADIRSAASNAWDELAILPSSRDRETQLIARAILAERAAERARCANLCEETGDNYVGRNEWDAGYEQACYSLALKIREGT